MRATVWPGAFVRHCSAPGDISAGSILTSPVLWVSVILGYVCALPGIGTLISWTDSGELMTSAYTLGISHPTGYPLFTVLSRSIILLFPWADPISLLHHLSAIFVSFGAGLVSLTTVVWISSMRKKNEPIEGPATAGIVAAVLFTTTFTVWQQAVSYEVYGFQVMVYAAALLSFSLALRATKDNRASLSVWWAMTGLVVGFGFSNHMMTLYLIPAFVWSMWKRGLLASRPRIMLITAPALIGLSSYAYLPIRSGSGPLMNWGDPSTLSAFVSHVTGRQYRVWMFPGIDPFLDAAGRFFLSVPSEVGWPALFFGLTGAAVMWKRDRHRFWFSVLLVSFTLLYSFNYDIHDIQTYFLLAFMVFAVLTAIGLRAVMMFLSSRWRWGTSLGVLMPFALIVLNTGIRYGAFEPVDRSSPEPFAREVLLTVEDGATVITGAWDFLYSPILALQAVEGLRPDVRMIDLHLLRDRTWYLRKILSNLAAGESDVRRKGDAFLAELTKFEQGTAYDLRTISLRWQEFLVGLVRALADAGPLYVDHEIARNLPALHAYKPEGFLLRAYEKDVDPGYDGMPEYHEIGRKQDKLTNYYRRFCSTVFFNHATFARAGGDSTAFVDGLEMARMIDPANPLLATVRR